MICNAFKRDDNFDGLRDLWGAVLIQAINDAMRVDAYSAEDRRAKDDAISWLNKGGRDFITVCTFAGLDPVAVHEAWRGGRIKPILTKGHQARRFTGFNAEAAQ